MLRRPKTVFLKSPGSQRSCETGSPCLQSQLGPGSRQEHDPQPSMRNANAKRFRFWHFHRSSSRAGPTYFQRFTLVRSPPLLRTQLPAPPPPFTISSQWKTTRPEQLVATLPVVQALDAFLAAHYTTKGGQFSYKAGSIPWLAVLHDPGTIALALRNPEGELCGTIISRAPSGTFGFLANKENPSPRTIEFLCIHPFLRTHGLASWMCAWLDRITHETYGPCVHMGWWSMERGCASPPSFPPLAQIRHYTKSMRSNLQPHERALIQPVDSAVAHRVLDEILHPSVKDWAVGDIGSSVETYYVPFASKTDGIRWWLYTSDELMGCSILVGLALPPFVESVAQVVYCSFVRRRPCKERLAGGASSVQDISMPFWEDSATYSSIPQQAITLALCAQGARLGVVTSIPSHYGGGRDPRQWDGWTKLSGERSNLILYNWMPPFFRNSNLLWLSSTL